MSRDEGDLLNEKIIDALIQYDEENASDIKAEFDIDENNISDEETELDTKKDNFETKSEFYKDEISDTEEITDIPATEIEDINYIEDFAENIDENDYDENVWRSEKKGTKTGIIIGIVAGIIAVTAFIGIDSGIIGRYKDNFAKNFSNIFRNFKSDNQTAVIEQPQTADAQYRADVKSNTIVSLEEAVKTEFAVYKNGIVFANMNHMTYLDNTGNIVWETDTAIVDPILKASGNYILLAEKNGNKICLYGDKKLIYDTDDPDEIIAAELSSAGDVVAVTDKSSYKGGISVYNKSGARIFSWAAGSSMVISADISAVSRCVAVATLNTENTAGTTVHLFDVNRTGSYADINIENTVVFDMKFTGDLLTAFGDNRIAGISASGRLLYDNIFENEQLTHSAIDDKGNNLLAFDNGNIPMINMYSKNGRLKANVTLTGVTDFIDINGKNILYNLGRDVYFGKINSDDIIKYTATMDIKRLLITSNNTFIIVYSNSIEIVTI